jgi:O-antigen/teichoic acid export membrane protein
LFQRQKLFKESGISEIVSKISYICIGVIGSIGGAGSLGLLLTTGAGGLGKILYLKAIDHSDRTDFKNRHIDFNYNFKKIFQIYGGLSSSMVASGLLNIYTTAIPIIAISHLYGPNELGQFSLVTLTLYLPASLIGAAIGQVYYQRAAQAWNNNEEIHTLWKRTTKKLVFMGAPIYILIGATAPIAYPAVFGAPWTLAGEVAIWMTLPAYISLISSPTDRTFLIVGSWKYPILWHFFRALATSVLVYLALLKNWSFEEFIIGLACQLAISYAVDIVFECYFSTKKNNVKEYNKK